MSAPASRATKRQSQIIAVLRQSGRVAVEDLAAHFNVALQTIRRDLNDLSEGGQVVRVHGGAIVASGVENLAYEARQLVAHDQKKLIGETAARLIPDNSSLFINIGTTTEEVAKRFRDIPAFWSSPTTCMSQANCTEAAPSKSS